MLLYSMVFPLPALNISSDDTVHPSEEWLGAIARGTMETYVTSILRIPSLTETAAHQLATDIGEWAVAIVVPLLVRGLGFHA